ncbi:MAG: hypothetical protein C4294_11475, partial [Nitrospiraceae bacterium]
MKQAEPSIKNLYAQRPQRRMAVLGERLVEGGQQQSLHGSAAASARTAGDRVARDRFARPIDDREVPAVGTGVQHVQCLRA